MPQNSPFGSEPDLGRDPAFYAQDIYCAVSDMAEQFSRDEFLAAVSQILLAHNIEIVDLNEFRNAA